MIHNEVKTWGSIRPAHKLNLHKRTTLTILPKDAAVHSQKNVVTDVRLKSPDGTIFQQQILEKLTLWQVFHAIEQAKRIFMVPGKLKAKGTRPVRVPGKKPKKRADPNTKKLPDRWMGIHDKAKARKAVQSTAQSSYMGVLLLNGNLYLKVAYPH